MENNKINDMEDLSIYNAPGTELRKIQLRMLYILDIVDDICKKHEITYWLSGGTLLGAVLHDGFIPWDDDLDIELMRKDYKKLLKILKKELPENLSVQTPNEWRYNLLFSKVRDKKSEIVEHDEVAKRYKQKGIFIDIVPQEYTYKPVKNIVDFFYGRAYRRIKRGRPFHSLQYFYEYSVALLMWPLATILLYLARLICFITKPEHIMYGYGIGNSPVHNQDYILPTGKIVFEGKKYAAPNDPEKYLKRQYGTYTKYLPVEQRPTHFNQVIFYDE